MVMGGISQKNINIMIISISDNKVSKYINQNLRELKAKLDNLTTIEGEVNTFSEHLIVNLKMTSQNTVESK